MTDSPLNSDKVQPRLIEEIDSSASLANGVGSSLRDENITLLPPADVLDTLKQAHPVQTVVLDPWYNRGIGGHRDDYNEWLSSVISAACDVAQHVFVWGFPDILAHQIAEIPRSFTLVSWLTWYYKNCPSVIRGWRSAQNACLHLAAQDAAVYPENFLTAEQNDRLKAGKMRFIPGPPSVIEAPLNVGFVGRAEQTGHPAQKPLAVIDPLIRMSTREGDVVLDPMCGSGTTGEACLRLNRRAILCDFAAEWLDVTAKRIAESSGR